MNLSCLFENCNVDININGIKTSSKDVCPGDLFVCIQGAKVDRHEFVEDAIKNGASCIVASKKINVNIPVIYVNDTNLELIRLLKVFYHHPDEKLKLIGITGTDGKTTTAKIIQQLIGDKECGYIGTLGADCSGYKDKTNNTTPPPEKIFFLLNEFVNKGMKFVSMEASSEGYFYKRLDGITFDIGCMCNITSEHMNTHGTLQNYIDCKKQLFVHSKKQVLNHDDAHFDEIKEVSKDFISYGKGTDNDLQIKDYALFPNHSNLSIWLDKKNYEITSSLLGKFNVENLSLALLVCHQLGLSIENLLEKTKSLVIPGRMQVINEGQNFYCICDYAHTANAVKNVLEFANSLNVNRIITVIGQAGGRDQTKRKHVGKYALEMSTHCILTADDPRFENPEDICQMMLEDTNNNNYEIIINRSKAIQKAIEMANENDLVLALGKGVDPYQKIEDRDEYYLETEELIQAIHNKK